jgi:hypothetical protein
VFSCAKPINETPGVAMSRNNEPYHLQRRHLLQGIAAWMLTLTLPAVKAIAATFTPPARLPATRSVYRVSGRAWVNGKRADAGTMIKPGDTVKTARDSEIVFAVGDHAMLLRGGSHLVIEPHQDSGPGSLLIGALRLFSGKLLSVSRNKGMRIHTTNVTIGIRGTGVYLEAGPDRTYFCNCYGEVDVVASHDAASKETVVSSHHDKPLYIYSKGQPGQCIHDAHRSGGPNHTDQELIMAEALVGRVPPFVV